jgi:cytochrome c oxidase cbb3-type subunit 3
MILKMNQMKIKNIILLTAAGLMVSQNSFAQAAKANANSAAMNWVFDNLLLLLGSFVLMAGIASILKLSLGLLEIQRIKMLQDLGEDPEVILKEVRTSRLEKFNNWFWSLKPERSESEMDLGHNYDGIRELDNSLPPWWLYLFYGSIIFAVVYMYRYHFSDTDWSSIKEYQIELEEAEDIKMAFLDKMANAVNETNVEALVDDASLEIGKEIFISQCASCHGQLGEGMVGPNFTDPYWIHGGGIKNVFKTIKYGVPEKGMISWKEQLKPSSMQKVASYILTLEGTDPPNQKTREGKIWEPEE